MSDFSHCRVCVCGYLGEQLDAAQQHRVLLFGHHRTEQLHGGFGGQGWGQEGERVLCCLTHLHREGRGEGEREGRGGERGEGETYVTIS